MFVGHPVVVKHCKFVLLLVVVLVHLLIDVLED
jgi:hypothetical protein